MFIQIDDKVINFDLVKYFYVDSTYGIYSLKIVFDDAEGGKKEILDFADFENKQSAEIFKDELAKALSEGKFTVLKTK